MLRYGPTLVASAARLLAAADASKRREQNETITSRLDQLENASAESARLLKETAEQIPCCGARANGAQVSDRNPLGGCGYSRWSGSGYPRTGLVSESHIIRKPVLDGVISVAGMDPGKFGRGDWIRTSDPAPKSAVSRLPATSCETYIGVKFLIRTT
jgi:hypothetical protein